MNTNLKPGLYIIGTPIGNLMDISERSLSVLNNVDFIICENPKISLKLLNNFGIKKKLISLHDHNEDKVILKTSKYFKNCSIALISDAGSPLISDPGYKLLRYCINNDVFVTSIPGASCLIPSLHLSGLPLNNFAFYGFAPKQKTKRRSFLLKIKTNSLTGVFFASKENIDNCLIDINDILGNIEIAVCKEISKINEKTIRGSVKKLMSKNYKDFFLKGEFTLVISPIETKKNNILDSSIKTEINKLLNKFSLTETVKIVHKLTNISKKDVYKMALKIKNV
ncbi:MAG: Ribosomal RNA small subunit methyltransferase I [Alphaproteobacteria bacterium MarineAlpha5_Bin9]|nr:MAG: Ribosomal RNA small subunit methyltransferase I [Alphaproteobacteria bacterium MarineAlpha5_Bin9]